MPALPFDSPLPELHPELGQVKLVRAGAAAAASLAVPPAISQGRQLDRRLLRLVNEFRMGNLYHKIPHHITSYQIVSQKDGKVKARMFGAVG